MRGSREFGLFVISAVLGIMMAHSEAQEKPLIPSFPAVVMRQVQSGGLTATYTRDGDVVTITVKTKDGKRPDDGWGGVCIENRTPVNLGGFTHVKATVRLSAKVVMDIKLEKTKYEEGTILLADKEGVGQGERVLEWELKRSTEVGNGTLSQTKRMCFFVLADDFPKGLTEVVVRVSGIQFDKK